MDKLIKSCSEFRVCRVQQHTEGGLSSVYDAYRSRSTYVLSLSKRLTRHVDSAFYRYGTRNGLSIFRIVLTPVVLCTVYRSHSAEITALIEK